MEDPKERDRHFREHLYSMKERCKKTKEMWSLPMRPYGFWTFERHNAQLSWDAQISQVPGRRDAYDDFSKPPTTSQLLLIPNEPTHQRYAAVAAAWCLLSWVWFLSSGEMRTQQCRNSKSSWPKIVVRKWLNIKSRSDEFHSDYAVREETMEERRKSCSDRDHYIFRKGEILPGGASFGVAENLKRPRFDSDMAAEAHDLRYDENGLSMSVLHLAVSTFSLITSSNWPVTDFNEIANHFLECIYIHCHNISS